MNESLIKIEKLCNCEGASRFGNCIACLKGSQETNGLRRITFKNRCHNFSTSIILCEEHMQELCVLLELEGGE